MTQIILQWQMHMTLNTQNNVVLLPTTCVLVDAGSWQSGATKNGKVCCQEARTYALNWWQPFSVLKGWCRQKMIFLKASELKTHPPHTHTHTKNKPTISTSTMAWALVGILITIKLTDVSNQRKAQSVITWVKTWVHCMVLRDAVLDHCVFIDE